MTAQVADSVTIDGEPWLLLETPLDGLLARIEAPDFVAPHTANWRGYVAQWRVDRDVLSLVGVDATVAGPGGQPMPVSGRDALGGLGLPLVADWVTGTLRVARGDQVRYVHMGFGSRWAEEVLLQVERGLVVARTVLDAPGPMGSAGPYRLIEPLLGGLSGGAFGQVILAADLDGAELVAKIARPSGGGLSATIMHGPGTVGARPPIHVPAVALGQHTGGPLEIREASGEELEAVLRNEAEILERDGGVLLPRSLGVWEHDPQGVPVLVMERLAGRRPERLTDVVAVLEALADAVARGTFDAHGDVKVEHVFVQDDGRVRLCDPAPRFDDLTRRGFTPMYNPRGHRGPAADIAACATMLRYVADDAVTAWRWCAAMLDDPRPPAWADTHRNALTMLRSEVGKGDPPPPGWTPPPLPDRTGDLGPMARPPNPPLQIPPTLTVEPTPSPHPPPVPPDWRRERVFCATSPDGVARVEVRVEVAAEDVRTDHLVRWAQPRLRELPGFEEVEPPSSWRLPSGEVASIQQFLFTGDDGVTVHRIQAHLVEWGWARTGIASAPADGWSEHYPVLRDALAALLSGPAAV